MMRKNLVKLIDLYPEEFHGKIFDYKCEKVDNHYIAYRRELENDPWKEYCQFAVVDGILFVNWTGYSVSMKEAAGHDFPGYEKKKKKYKKEE